VKRKTRESDRAAWKSHIEARFGDAPVASITPAEIAHWVGGLVFGGISPSTASRYLATLRSILAYAVADGRVSQNAAASVRAPTAGHVRREGQFLTREELDELAAACRGVYADVVKIWASPACAGVNSPVSRSRVRGCGCSARCWPAARAASCSSTRSRASGPAPFL
jgi:integrase